MFSSPHGYSWACAWWTWCWPARPLPTFTMVKSQFADKLHLGDQWPLYTVQASSPTTAAPRSGWWTGGSIHPELNNILRNMLTPLSLFGEGVTSAWWSGRRRPRRRSSWAWGRGTRRPTCRCGSPAWTAAGACSSIPTRICSSLTARRTGRVETRVHQLILSENREIFQLIYTEQCFRNSHNYGFLFVYCLIEVYMLLQAD